MITHFAIEPDGSLRSFSIVSYMSRTKIGPKFLKAIGANAETKMRGLELEDAQIIMAELESLMSETVRSWPRYKK